jgi:hypothetical protein
MFYNSIVSLLERNNQFKNIRSEYSLAVGSNDFINEERMEKMESNLFLYHRFHDCSNN